MTILQIIYDNVSSINISVGNMLDAVTCGHCSSLYHSITNWYHGTRSDIGMTTFSSFSAGEPTEIPTEPSSAPARIENFRVDYGAHLPNPPNSAPAGGTFRSITDGSHQD